MKIYFILPLMILLTAFIMSFTVNSDYRIARKTAEVKQIQGLYIFFCAEPVMDYKYLGSCEKASTWDDDTDSRINAIIKKCKKEYPYADAIVFRELDLLKCDCIKFTD